MSYYDLVANKLKPPIAMMMVGLSRAESGIEYGRIYVSWEQNYVCYLQGIACALLYNHADAFTLVTYRNVPKWLTKFIGLSIGVIQAKPRQ